jgi:hypothetical protein
VRPLRFAAIIATLTAVSILIGQSWLRSLDRQPAISLGRVAREGSQAVGVAITGLDRRVPHVSALPGAREAAKRIRKPVRPRARGSRLAAARRPVHTTVRPAQAAPSSLDTGVAIAVVATPASGIAPSPSPRTGSPKPVPKAAPKKPVPKKPVPKKPTTTTTTTTPKEPSPNPTPAPAPPPAPAPSPAPTAPPQAPPADPPLQPPVTPAKPQPVPAQPVPAQPVPQQPVPAQPVPQQPVPAQPVQSQPVPAQPATPVPAASTPDSSRPGWGYGDRNHEHTGPPGHGGKPGRR